jgi:hypothetical protein
MRAHDHDQQGAGEVCGYGRRSGTSRIEFFLQQLNELAHVRSVAALSGFDDYCVGERRQDEVLTRMIEF